MDYSIQYFAQSFSANSWAFFLKNNYISITCTHHDAVDSVKCYTFQHAHIH